MLELVCRSTTFHMKDFANEPWFGRLGMLIWRCQSRTSRFDDSVVTRCRGQPQIGFGHCVATTGRRRVPTTVCWHALKKSPRGSAIHSLVLPTSPLPPFARFCTTAAAQRSSPMPLPAAWLRTMLTSLLRHCRGFVVFPPPHHTP